MIFNFTDYKDAQPGHHEGSNLFHQEEANTSTDENAKSHLSSTAVEKQKSNANTSFDEKNSKSPLLSKSS